MSVLARLLFGTFRNPDNLPKDLIEDVKDPSGGLSGHEPDPVTQEMIRYLVDSEPADVLLKLGGSEVLAKIALHRSIDNSMRFDLRERMRKKRRSMFAKVPPDAVRFFERLGEVFEAASSPSRIKFLRPEGWPAWLPTLLFEIVDASANNGYDYTQYGWGDQVRVLGAEALTHIFGAAGLTEAAIVELFFPSTAFLALSPRELKQLIPALAIRDWKPLLARNGETLARQLTGAGGKAGVEAIETLGKLDYDFAPVLPQLAALAVAPTKTLREACFPHVQRNTSAIRPHLEALARTGDAGQRGEAVTLLGKLKSPGLRELLEELQSNDSSERVRQTIEKALAGLAGAAAVEDEPIELPPLAVELGEQLLSEAAKERLRDHVRKRYDKAVQERTEAQAKKKAGGDDSRYVHVPPEPEKPTEKFLTEFIDAMEGRVPVLSQARNNNYNNYLYDYKDPFGEWMAPPEFKLIRFVRICNLCGMAGANDYSTWSNSAALDAYRSRCPQQFGLRELCACWKRPQELLEQYLTSLEYSYMSFADWEPEAIWPAFQEHLPFLISVLTGESKGNRYYVGEQGRIRAALKVTAMLPKVPARLVPILWDLAIGEAKTDRKVAQAALDKLPGKSEQIQRCLGDGKQTIRAVAAEWLGDLGDATAIEPLKEAFRVEKQEVVKGAMLQALDKLGADVNEFLDRDGLVKEAKTGLSKKLPAGMEWVPLDRLPPLHWQDSGKKVAAEVAKWWVVQCVAQKSPTCGPILRRYMAMVKPADAAAFGKFLLSAWIGYDTQSPSGEDAATAAEKETAKLWANKYVQDHYKSRDKLYADMLAGARSKFLNSAIGQKGLLAIPAAVGDSDCAKLAEAYIRTHFGNRLAQCKALVEMLSWMPNPLALQVLLSLGNRFRTKAVRQLAAEIVHQVAEREGWTIDQLADRTIPDAGFARAEDAEGRPIGRDAVLTLDFGPRQFTVTLNDELEPVIATAEGKTVKNLPAPGKADDEAKAKDAKKIFSDAKKQVRDVVKRQKERLYESLCTQRSWPFAEWKKYLADHPIVGRHCVKLVWATASGENPAVCFRPMEDGSLTNEHDEAVTIADDAVVRLAHSATVTADADAAWLAHLKDYEVEAPFAQFGRTVFRLPDDQKKATELKDFEGYGLANFKLRGRATKLGYVRGEAEDGGVFGLYRKPFPSLKIDAEIHFSGSGLPETDIPVALYHLAFARQKSDGQPGGWNTSCLELGKVPPVLLGECYNDLKLLAAEGTGFNADCKKVGFY